MLKKLFLSAAVKLFELLAPMLVELLKEEIDARWPEIIELLKALIPLAVAAGIKGLGDILPDINMPDLPEVIGTVTRNIPDIDVPFLSDAVKSATGFDLTEWLAQLGSK